MHFFLRVRKYKKLQMSSIAFRGESKGDFFVFFLFFYGHKISAFPKAIFFCSAMIRLRLLFLFHLPDKKRRRAESL